MKKLSLVPFLVLLCGMLSVANAERSPKPHHHHELR